MPAPVCFGLAFGSLVFVRALLDAGGANFAVTFIMFLFFAGISGVAYLGTAVLIGRRPLFAAALTAFALLLLVTLPSILHAPLTTMLSARVIVRVFSAWVYVCIVFAGFSSIVGMKLKSLVLLALAPFALSGQPVEEFAPPQTLMPQNRQAITELAQLHGKVILCSVLPVSARPPVSSRSTLG
jgi:hypothetical protein